ncbi:MAG: hypothetical protein KY476_27080, partial [Planctomycetes bacterium]|nr:hypothetical protein [Planctomycetota bacterium]
EDATLDVAAVNETFQACWNAWNRDEPLVERDASDIGLGSSRLRLSELSWVPPRLALTYEAARLKIGNASDSTVTYQTKGPHHPWGGPFTLEPGAAHKFDVAFPMLFRRQVNGRWEHFTLPAGAHVEFRTRPKGGPRLFTVRGSTKN